MRSSATILGALAACLLVAACATGPEMGPPTTYEVYFENFTAEQVLEVIHRMRTDVPGFVRSTDVEGASTRVKFGYVSRLIGVEMYLELHRILKEMGLDPDRRVQVVKEGKKIKLKKLGSDEPRFY